MSEQAKQLVTALLDDDHDEHMKAWQRIQKWDKAHSAYKELAQKRKEADSVYRELGQAIGLERALAKLGLKREDVDHYIHGGHIGSTHNYKRQVPGKACKSPWCGLLNRPVNLEQEKCSNCGEPLETRMRAITPSELRGKYERYIVGAKLTDGRTVWFEDMIPPRTHDFAA